MSCRALQAPSASALSVVGPPRRSRAAPQSQGSFRAVVARGFDEGSVTRLTSVDLGGGPAGKAERAPSVVETVQDVPLESEVTFQARGSPESDHGRRWTRRLSTCPALPARAAPGSFPAGPRMISGEHVFRKSALALPFAARYRLCAAQGALGEGGVREGRRLHSRGPHYHGQSRRRGVRDVRTLAGRFGPRCRRSALRGAVMPMPSSGPQADKSAGLGAAKRGYVYFTEVKSIPVADLRTVDELWKTYRCVGVPRRVALPGPGLQGGPSSMRLYLRPARLAPQRGQVRVQRAEGGVAGQPPQLAKVLQGHRLGRGGGQQLPAVAHGVQVHGGRQEGAPAVDGGPPWHAAPPVHHGAPRFRGQKAHGETAWRSQTRHGWGLAPGVLEPHKLRGRWVVRCRLGVFPGHEHSRWSRAAPVSARLADSLLTISLLDIS